MGIGRKSAQTHKNPAFRVKSKAKAIEAYQKKVKI